MHVELACGITLKPFGHFRNSCLHVMVQTHFYCEHRETHECGNVVRIHHSSTGQMSKKGQEKCFEVAEELIQMCIYKKGRFSDDLGSSESKGGG